MLFVTQRLKLLPAARKKEEKKKQAPLLSVCEWICAHLCPGSVVISNCSFDAFPSCLPGLVTGHGRHWSLSWTEVWPRFGDTLGTTSIWTPITGVLVGVWMLGRGWGMVAEAEPSITMYTLRHHFRFGVVCCVFFPLSSLRCIKKGSCKCVYDMQEAAFGLPSSTHVFLG